MSKPVMKPIKSLQHMQELQAEEDQAQEKSCRLTESSVNQTKIIKNGYEVTVEAEYIVDGRKKRRVKKKKIKKSADASIKEKQILKSMQVETSIE